MPLLLAELQTEPSTRDDRRAVRRRVRLELPTRSSRHATRVLIHDLSETGLMMQTVAELAVGEVFEVELPQVGLSSARVVWKRETQYGCEFLSPVTKAAVSAALLLAPHERPYSPAESPAAETSSHDPKVRERAPASQTAVMASLTFLTLVVMLFIVALLSAPFSTD